MGADTPFVWASVNKCSAVCAKTNKKDWFMLPSVCTAESSASAPSDRIKCKISQFIRFRGKMCENRERGKGDTNNFRLLWYCGGSLVGRLCFCLVVSHTLGVSGMDEWIFLKEVARPTDLHNYTCLFSLVCRWILDTNVWGVIAELKLQMWKCERRK